MTYLSRDEILAADDLPTADVEVPEWGGTVRVRALDGASRDAYDFSLYAVTENGRRKMTPDNIRAKFAALSIIDGEGALLFSTEDVIRLGRKSATALDRVVEKARRLSAMTAEEVEEMVEDFEPAQNEDSSSDSASRWAEPAVSSSQN